MPIYLRRIDAMSNCVSTRSQTVGGAAGRIHLGSRGCPPEEARDGVTNVDDFLIGEGVGEHGVPLAGRFPVGHAPQWRSPVPAGARLPTVPRFYEAPPVERG